MISIAILGSTGSIGTQVLDVCKRIGDKINISAIGAMDNADLLIKQIKDFEPDFACIGNTEKYEYVKSAVKDKKTEIITGDEGFIQLASINTLDKIIIAIAGFPGFNPTITALENKTQVCLASKEVLVAGGHIVSALAKEKKLPILPIDSEHSAIFQCLNGENHNEIKQIILTASGGAFREKSIEELSKVTSREALNHPTWKMGKKVTIDSATLMNKGLEIIEAKWLFNLKPEQISVIIHHQSIVHSMIEFNDSAIIAQMGMPDMRVPIQYSLLYPERLDTNLPRLDLTKIKNLSFDNVNYEKFPSLRLAREALIAGGSMPCILNASDNAAVNLFLENKINFLDISKIVETEMTRHNIIPNPDINTIISLDKEIQERIYRDYTKQI